MLCPMCMFLHRYKRNVSIHPNLFTWPQDKRALDSLLDASNNWFSRCSAKLFPFRLSNHLVRSVTVKNWRGSRCFSDCCLLQNQTLPPITSSLALPVHSFSCSSVLYFWFYPRKVTLASVSYWPSNRVAITRIFTLGKNIHAQTAKEF